MLTSLTAGQILALYVWFPIIILLVFLLLIARFYERFSSEKTFFHLYAVPILLFGAATARYSSINQIAGDVLGDLFFAGAGAILTILCLYLYRLMTRGR